MVNYFDPSNGPFNGKTALYNLSQIKITAKLENEQTHFGFSHLSKQTEDFLFKINFGPECYLAIIRGIGVLVYWCVVVHLVLLK